MFENNEPNFVVATEILHCNLCILNVDQSSIHSMRGLLYIEKQTYTDCACLFSVAISSVHKCWIRLYDPYDKRVAIGLRDRPEITSFDRVTPKDNQLKYVSQMVNGSFLSSHKVISQEKMFFIDTGTQSLKTILHTAQKLDESDILYSFGHFILF